MLEDVDLYSAAHAASVQVLGATVKDQAIAGATVVLQIHDNTVKRLNPHH